MFARNRPTLTHAEQTAVRLAPNVVQQVLLFALSCLAIWITASILTPSLHHILPFQVLAGVVLIICLLLNRSGYRRATAVVLCSSMWFLVQVPPFVNGRLAVPGLLLPLLLVLATGLMWSTRAAILLGVGSCLAWLAALLAIEQGLVATTAPLQSDFVFWLILTLSLAVVSTGLLVVTRALQGTARHSGRSPAEGFRAPSDHRPATELESGPDAGEAVPQVSAAARPGREDLELVGQLAGGIAHDFNNLLTVVAGATELIEDDPNATGSILALAGQIRKAQERAAVITRRLLFLAQQQVVETRRLELGPAVKIQVEDLGQFLGSGITLDLSVTADDTTVLSSDAEVEQILLNLLTNARDAIDGTGPISVRVARRSLAEPCDGPAGVVAPGQYVVVSVEDRGKGISPAGLVHVFEPFYTTHGRSSGRGLGLPAVRGIAGRNGGQVLIESTEGSGTLVEVLLPLETPARS